uniref:Uncharacterized protein n=2 Tax=Auxenochlorella protothecoides TaxID=3075 RepID=A0A1D1ZX53_AUXPR
MFSESGAEGSTGATTANCASHNPLTASLLKHCALLGVSPPQEYVDALLHVPSSLVLEAPGRPPQDGGAALHLANIPVTEEQLMGLLNCLLAPLPRLLLRHLDLSRCTVNTRVIQQLVGMVSSDPEASAWRLEGLGLRQCQLPPGAMSLLTQPKAQRLLSHLAWLDLSQNPELLRNPLESQDWMALWRLAPLRHLDLTVTGASLSCLAQALHWLVHSAPLSATARCAEYRHDGALASLRSLSISVAASAEAEGRDEEELLLGRLLAAFVAAAPCLVRLEVQGLTSAAANDAICAAWHVRFSGTEASTLMDAAGTLHLSSGSAQESSAASRAPCQHMLPSPSTPPAGAFGDHQALGSAATEHAEVAPPPPFLLPGVVASRQRHLGPPSHAPSSSLGPLEGDMFHGDGGPAPAALPPFLPSQRPAVGSRRSRDPGAIYRGSEALPDFGMDLEGERSAEHSEEEEEDSDVSGSASSDGGESDADIDLGRLQAAPAEAPSPQAATMPRDTQALERRGAEGAGASEPPAAAQQSRFRIEDGQLDDDDVAARRYARLVPQMIRSIPDEEDCKRARQAYRHWFNMASDPWDRRRWVNPRIDREDSPELLGLLNLLYDLLEAHGLHLDFPFPLRKPGGGKGAFLPALERSLEQVPEPASPPHSSSAAPDQGDPSPLSAPTATQTTRSQAQRGARRIADSEDEDEDGAPDIFPDSQPEDD